MHLICMTSIKNPIVYLGDFKFDIRTRAARHVLRIRGNSRLNKGISFIM